jgi:hypothetical protein
MRKERQKETRKQAKEKRRKLDEDAEKARARKELDVVVDAQEEEMNA